MTQLTIHRAGSPHITVDIDEQTVFTKAVMAEHVLASQFDAPVSLDIRQGDYVMVNGEKMKLNKPVIPVEKSGSNVFAYSLRFEGPIYDLIGKILTQDGALVNQLYVTAEELVDLIVDNLNSIGSGWSRGTVTATEPKTIDFTTEGAGSDCKSALAIAAKAYELEFWLQGKTINMTEAAGVERNITFEVGRGKGLRRVVRGDIPDDQRYFNRIIARGGSKNIPADYRGGAQYLRIDAPYLELPLAEGQERVEGSAIFEDIYPDREAALTAVSEDMLSLTDTTLDFDLNGQKIEGETATVHFTTGANAGQDFDLGTFNADTKTFRIKPVTREDGRVFPSADWPIVAGDKYKFFGIELPESYFTDAETKLAAEMQKALEKAATIKPPYQVDVDEKFVRDNGFMLDAGDRVTLKDSQLFIDDRIRVQSISYPIVRPARWTLVLSDKPVYSVAGQLIIDSKEKERVIHVNKKELNERARRNAIALNALDGRLFDPETGAIAPALRAAMAIYGYDSQNFNLVDVTISPNDGGDANRLVISAGTLVHRIYEIPGLGYEWAVAPAEFPALDPAKFYYVYAKASRTGLTATWGISETPVTVNAFPGFWVFNVGVLYEVADGYRNFEFTKGMTYIVGDQITTGIIRSIDGNTFWDLNNASQQWGDAMDFNVTAPGLLNIKEALASKIIQVGSEGVINAGISGVTDAGTSSIRFWAGSSDKNLADFRVQDNGQVFATRVKLGYGEADGTATGWDVTPSGILSDPKPGETQNFALIRGTSYNKEFSFGTELIPATSGDQVSMVGRVQNNRPQTDEVFPTTNIALQLRADGANNNFALDISKGGIRLPGNKIGLTTTRTFKIQDNQTGGVELPYECEFVNGNLVRMSPAS